MCHETGPNRAWDESLLRRKLTSKGNRLFFVRKISDSGLFRSLARLSSPHFFPQFLSFVACDTETSISGFDFSTAKKKKENRKKERRNARPTSSKNTPRREVFDLHGCAACTLRFPRPVITAVINPAVVCSLTERSPFF